jgi:uncharacterized membrane protein (UPF0127 family)
MITCRVELNRRRLRLCVDVCQTPIERARGLLLRRRPRRDHAMLITRCSAVHTFGLWYPIDLAFCTGDGTVLEVVPRVRPCRMARCAQAGQVWELPAGLAEELDLRAGDRLAAT